VTPLPAVIRSASPHSSIAHGEFKAWICISMSLSSSRVATELHRMQRRADTVAVRAAGATAAPPGHPPVPPKPPPLPPQGSPEKVRLCR